jgi:hypothetical protein
MTSTDFFRQVERTLQARGVPFDAGELLAFIEGMFPLIKVEDPPLLWAGAFLQAQAGRQPVPA